MDRIQAVREVMTLEEVAEYLQVSEKSVLRMAQSGKIPAAKVASQWRFMRSVVDDWLMAQMEIPSVRSAPARKEPPKLPPLTELMPASAMNLEVTPGTKDEVLKQLVHLVLSPRHHISLAYLSIIDMVLMKIEFIHRARKAVPVHGNYVRGGRRLAW